MTHLTTEPAPTLNCSPRSRVGGSVSVVFMVSVLIGLALNPSGLLGSTTTAPTRHEGGTVPRHVEQIRCLAESIVRVTTRAAKHDRQVPMAGFLLDELNRDGLRGSLMAVGGATQVVALAPSLREALLSLPPPVNA
jgi:hypothetical protein